MEWLRKILAQLRTRTTTVARIGTRFNRTARYLFQLLIWSRIFVTKRNLAQIEFSPKVLRRKNVVHPQPHLEMKGAPGGERFEKGFRVIYGVLFANLRKADELSPHRHAVPGPAFAGVYLWDSAFIALIWQHWDRQVAADILRSVIDLRDGARLQHVVTDFVKSDYTQPPLIAWAAARIIRGMEPAEKLEFLDLIYQPLCDYHEWLQMNRRLPNGLYFWEHPYESGKENAPRFSNRDESVLRDTRNIAAPDLSAYVILQCEALAEFAGIRGENDRAAEYVARASELRERIDAELWHSGESSYFDRENDTGEYILSNTIASLMPLAAGVPDAGRARKMLTQIMSPTGYGSPIPFPSTAIQNPDFAKDMWRGPVWINTAYLVLNGLWRNGFLREGAELAWRLCDGVYRVLEAEHQVYEFYDPECYHSRDLSRKRGNWWKALTLGTGPQKEFVGWSGLVNTILIEYIIGYSREDGQPILRPCFPSQAEGLQFQLTLASDNIEIELEVLPEGSYEGTVRLGDEPEVPLRGTFGGIIELNPLQKVPL